MLPAHDARVSTFESLTLKVLIECRACEARLPVNGILPSVRCHQCGEVTRAEFWNNAVMTSLANRWREHKANPAEAPFWTAALLLLKGRSTSTSETSTLQLFELGRGLPQCQRCNGPVLGPGTLAEAAPQGHCHCPACGRRIRVRLADALCKEMCPGARFLVHEILPDDAAIEARAEPVVFACMQCGGSLPADGAARTITCTYCQSSNYLPDAVWQKLNPVPKPETFFLVIEL